LFGGNSLVEVLVGAGAAGAFVEASIVGALAGAGAAGAFVGLGIVGALAGAGAAGAFVGLSIVGALAGAGAAGAFVAASIVGALAGAGAAGAFVEASIVGATTLTGWFALLGLLVFGTSGTPAVLGWSWSSTPLLRYPLRAGCVAIGLGVLFGIFLVFIAAVRACFPLYRALIGLR